MLLMRILVNALALLITGLLTPTMDLVDATLLNWFLLAILLGVFNAASSPSSSSPRCALSSPPAAW